jgi:hypothetical protein
MTTRNRDQASHAHHRLVRRPPRRGPSPVPLQPHRRLRYPGPEHPAVPGPVGLLRRRDGPSGRAVGAGEAHRDDLLVNSVGPDPAPGPLDKLLDLRQEVVDELRPHGPLGRIDPLAPKLDIAPHRVVAAPGQLGRLPVTPRGSYASRISMISSSLFTPPTLRYGLGGSAGRSAVRHRGGLVSASGEANRPPLGSLPRPLTLRIARWESTALRPASHLAFEPAWTSSYPPPERRSRMIGRTSPSCCGSGRC